MEWQVHAVILESAEFQLEFMRGNAYNVATPEANTC